MKLQELTESAGSYVYHVTFTKNVPNIKKIPKAVTTASVILGILRFIFGLLWFFELILIQSKSLNTYS